MRLRVADDVDEAHLQTNNGARVVDQSDVQTMLFAANVVERTDAHAVKVSIKTDSHHYSSHNDRVD